ncbi:MAG: hypothetical protein ACE5HB_08585 [Terriglobia bacterium]
MLKRWTNKTTIFAAIGILAALWLLYVGALAPDVGIPMIAGLLVAIGLRDSLATGLAQLLARLAESAREREAEPRPPEAGHIRRH